MAGMAGMGGGMPGMMGGMPQQQMGGGYGGGGGSFAPQPPARTPSAAEEQLRSALAAAGMGVGGLSFDERLEPGRWDGWAVDCTLNGNVLGTGRGRTADAAREQAATQVLGSLSAMQSGAAACCDARSSAAGVPLDGRAGTAAGTAAAAVDEHRRRLA